MKTSFWVSCWLDRKNTGHRTIRIGKLHKPVIYHRLYKREHSAVSSPECYCSTHTLSTKDVLESDDMLPNCKEHCLCIHPSITHSRNRLPHYQDCKLNAKCRCEWILACLSSITSNRCLLIMSAMWFRIIVMRRVSLETRTRDIFVLHWLCFISSNEDYYSF